jgi:hypothetical protein
VAAVQQALAGRRRTRASRRIAGRLLGVTAAAAMLVVAGWMILGSRGGMVSERAKARRLAILSPAPGTDPSRPVAPGLRRNELSTRTTLPSGARLRAPATEELRLGSTDGTIVTLEAGGALALGEQAGARRFVLEGGAVRAQVTRLQGDERFIISTPDAEVEVHGTVFRVSVGQPAACAGGTRTRVSVFEGVVSVRARGGESFVPAGREWPACIAEAAPSDKAMSPGPPPTNVGVRSNQSARTIGTSPVRESKRSRVTAKVSSSPAGTSGLVEANDLFAAAVLARREGNGAEALRLVSRLLELAPDGPLAEGARVQRMKLLARSDREAARQAAMEYLARYPDGVARDEARKLAGTGP